MSEKLVTKVKEEIKKHAQDIIDGDLSEYLSQDKDTNGYVRFDDCVDEIYTSSQYTLLTQYSDQIELIEKTLGITNELFYLTMYGLYKKESSIDVCGDFELEEYTNFGYRRKGISIFCFLVIECFNKLAYQQKDDLMLVFGEEEEE